MIKLVTFTDSNMTISAERCVSSALKFGAESAETFTPFDFDHTFKQLISPLIEGSRGYGWWMWKPWLIFNAITRLQDGDILIYSDAGQEIIGDLKLVINGMDDDIILFSNGWQHSHWCKKEVAISINGYECFNGFDELLDPNSYYKHKQVQASFILFKVNQKMRDFVQEWYAWSMMPGMIDNTPRGEQFPEFQEHRHDQAILTCLQIKYGYKLHWFPSETGMHLEKGWDNYPAILRHHRKRNHEW